MIARKDISSEIEKTFHKHQKRAYSLRQENFRSRLKVLRELERWIHVNKEVIREAVYNDFKKTPEEVAISDIYPVLTEIRKVKRHLKFWVRPKPVRNSLPFWGTSSRVYYEPKGTTLIISPWNYPFMLAVAPLVSSIAAGNTAILKPSELSPHTSSLIKEMVSEVFPEDLVTVFEGGVETSTKLLRLPFDHIFFTGSPAVGEIVMSAAAKNLTSVTLELGGKSPVVIDETANLKDAAEKIAWGKWLNSGQSCVAPDYIIIHYSAKEKFLNYLKLYAEKLYGNLENYTAIVNEFHYQRLREWLAEAISDGAELVYGGKVDDAVKKMGPTVVADPPPDSHLAKNEIFGPVLPILTYHSIEDPIDYINQRPKPLALYLFTKKKSTIKKMNLNTSAGSMVINDCVLQFGHPELPMGGVNTSGFGKAHGHYGFLAFSNEKSVLKQRTGFTMAKTLYPPFGKFKKTVLELLLRHF